MVQQTGKCSKPVERLGRHPLHLSGPTGTGMALTHTLNPKTVKALQPKPWPGCFLFLLWPLFARAPRHWFLEIFLLSVPGVQSVFFLVAPLGAATFRRGQSKKKTPPRVFFFAPAPGKGRGRRSPVGRRHGARAKKKHHPGCFFFAAAPRGRSLTHCGPGWRCLPLGGVVFFFLLRPRPDRGGVFFLLWPRPDAHSLTVGWGDFGKARVVFCFLLRPRRVFLDNNKKCLGYYIGSKKTRRGHSKKKKHHFP